MYIKISNLMNTDGKADYKGLDLNLIVAGSQIYPNDNTAYLKYNGTAATDNDITELTESDYLAKKNEIEKPATTIESRVSAIEIALAGMMGV